MSRFAAFFVVLLMVASLAGCVPDRVLECSNGGDVVIGSGNLVTQEEDYTGFDAVEVGHTFEAEIRQGETFAVVLRVDDNLQQYVRVDKVGNQLKIGLKPNLNICIEDATMEAEITMPELVGLHCSGASEATIEGFESSETLVLDASGASEVRGDIEAGRVSIDASGASSVRLSGAGTEVTVDASGASDVDLRDLAVGDADVEAGGGSDVTVNASGTLDADASGGATIYYVGSPTLGRMHTTGGGSIRPN